MEEQLTFDFDKPTWEIKKVPAGDKLIIGGIYMEDNDEEYDGKYAVSFGRAYHFLYDEIDDITSDNVIGGRMLYLPEYVLSYDPIRKQWKIKDSGIHGGKHIIAQGRYIDDFEKSLKPYLKIFMK